MVNTIGLISVTGQLGAPLCAALAKLHTAGELVLVVLHRPSSDTAHVPAGIEKRILDIENASVEDVSSALEGVDILINATGHTVPPSATETFLAALATLKLKTYIPSDFSVNWRPQALSNPANVTIRSKAALNERAYELGVPLTLIHNGFFTAGFFYPAFLGLDVAQNTLSLYADALRRTIPVTSPRFLAESIARLVTLPAEQLRGRMFTITEVEITGQQLADAMEKVNGGPHTITEYTESEAKADQDKGPFGAMAAAARRAWGGEGWGGEGRFEAEGVEARSIEEMVREAKLAASG